MNKKLLLTISLLTTGAGLSATQHNDTQNTIIGLSIIAVAAYATYKIGSYLFGDSVTLRTQKEIAVIKEIIETGCIYLVERLPDGRMVKFSDNKFYVNIDGQYYETNINNFK